MRLFLVIVLLLSLVSFAERISNRSGIFRDSHGRQVIFHGVNVINKRPPYFPQDTGFDAKMAVFIASQGFNLVRLGVYWAAIEPEPSQYNDDYLVKIQEVVDLLAKNNIYTLIDFHQDAYSTKHGGAGAPEWAALAQGDFANPGFPINLFGGMELPGMQIGPQLDGDYDGFWNNDPAPDGMGVQDHFLSMLSYVTNYFKGNENIIGYELMNEPFVGTDWPKCTVSVLKGDFSVGCRDFEQGALQAFYQRSVAAIRQIDKQTIVFFEPHLFFGLGAPTITFDLNDATNQTGFSFHDYNNKVEEKPIVNAISLNIPIIKAHRQRENNHAVPLMTEFGAASNTPRSLDEILASADNYQMSWTYWSFVNNPVYKFFKTSVVPTDPRKQGIVFDMKESLEGNNVKRPFLVQLTRVYPRHIAGTSTNFSFDPRSNEFHLEYDAHGMEYHRDTTALQTEIFIPLDRYPMGYQVDVSGATVRSWSGSELLIIVANKPGKVSVIVKPQGLPDNNIELLAH